SIARTLVDVKKASDDRGLMRKISGALLKETSFLRLATLALQILKLIHWFRPYNRSARGALETVRRLCQRINEVMIYAQNT
ncbi:hypothetical protein SU67_25045, partial [Escherichia coli O139:H28 str. E24377A]